MQTLHHLARIICSKSALPIRTSSRLKSDRALKFQDETVLPDFRQIEPGYLRSLLPNKAPEDGEDFEAVFGDFQDKVVPGVTHWQHPNFHAYFPTGSTYPSMLGDLLSSALAPVGVTWMACPACTELEVITLDWLVQAMGLPEKFLSTCSIMDRFHQGGGTIESSASLACATLMMGLRENALAKLFGGGVKKTEDGLRGCGAATNVDRLVAYTSDQAHSSVTRAFRISMVRYREIPTKPVGRKRVFSAEELRRAMAQDKAAGLIPLVCVATTGTTSTCEFDDVEAIGRVCKEFNVWFHLDAAYAGSALLCPEYRTLANGLQVGCTLFY
ncbi:aromatic-L-amino-acid/L-tryptophan decarboxylase [Paragonimus westermani]|uniref:Aromatic-L-amino-acid/L-tryptophan decarboxylase n=1 Tax=Paragonimus westermani TaxID=34504 RepID=A0A5J4NQ06_9TREM|nr:aromatic-L-amino-acid/L-tryptophan decarboxylase [Paragonimus westermani]